MYRAGRPICRKILLCFSLWVVRACLGSRYLQYQPINKCDFMLFFCVNPLLHTWQTNGLFPVCILLCISNCDLKLKLIVQKSHLKRPSFVLLLWLASCILGLVGTKLCSPWLWSLINLAITENMTKGKLRRWLQCCLRIKATNNTTYSTCK